MEQMAAGTAEPPRGTVEGGMVATFVSPPPPASLPPVKTAGARLAPPGKSRLQ